MSSSTGQSTLSNPFDGSCWIWPQRFADLQNSYAQFRHDFKLEQVPKKAWLSITADQSYKLYINGEYVARGPARGFQHRWPYDKIDLASFLKPGHNWLSVEVYNPAISTFAYLHQAAAGLLIFAKWGKTKIQTGPDWLCRMDTARAEVTPRLSVQMGFQEHLDLQAEDRRWITSSKKPAKWHNSAVSNESRIAGAMPWHSFESRNVPMLTNDWFDYQLTDINLVADTSADMLAENKSSDKSNPTNLYADLNWRRDKKSRTISNVKKESKWVSLPSKKSNQATATVVDLGRPGVGFLQLQIKNALAGQRFDVLFSEVIDDQGVPIIHHQKSNHSMIAMGSHLTLKAGNSTTQLFNMIGHRYLILVTYGKSEVSVKPTLCQNVYPLDIRGSFSTDNSELNDIYRISVQTQQVCALDAYVDTPWREQAQWWGDARVQSQNTFHLCNDTRLFERGIDQIATQEVPNGLTYGHAPTIAHGCVLPDFSLVWLITLWDLYQQTGDASVIQRYWSRVERVLSYFQGEGLHKSGLLQHDPRYWLFLDWCDLPKNGCPTLLNLWYLYALDKLIELTQQANMTDPNRQLVKLRRQAAKAVETLLWDDKKGLYLDGLDPKGKPVRHHAIHNQTLAILAGLHPKSHAGMMEKILLPYLNNQKIAGPSPSSYWVTYVYEAATSLGYGKQVIENLHRQWSPMIPYEGTKETFGRLLGQDSCTHAWAAHPIFHLTRTIGGVTQTAPGWKTVRFAPVITSPLTDRAKVIIPTPHGLIRAQWQRVGNQIKAKLSLPIGIEATVNLPGIVNQKVTGKQSWQCSQ